MNSSNKTSERTSLIRRYYLLAYSFIIVCALLSVEMTAVNLVYAQSPFRVLFPQQTENPMIITRPGYAAVKMFLPAHEQIISHIPVQGGAMMYRARNWCVLADPVIPTLDFGCDMNSGNNPMIESKPVWPPKVFTLDFVLPAQWFISAVDSTVLANTGVAVPIKDQIADQVGIFAPGVSSAPVLGFLPAQPSAPINIMTIQAYARCDFQAYYHMRIHVQQIVIDQSQTTQNCHPRFPPLIQL